MSEDQSKYPHGTIICPNCGSSVSGCLDSPNCDECGNPFWSTSSDIYKGIQAVDFSTREGIMKEWDKWREAILAGEGSWPRDAFESLLDHFDEREQSIREKAKKVKETWAEIPIDVHCGYLEQMVLHEEAIHDLMVLVNGEGR